MFIPFVMTRADELLLRGIQSLQLDRTVVPWIKAADVLGIKTMEMSVISDSRVQENDRENYGSLIDLVHENGVTVCTDDYVDIKVYADVVLYQDGDANVWIFRPIQQNELCLETV